MDYVIKIMAPAERNYCYTDSQQLDKQTGCIGHLRGDMDKSGNGFFTSWWDHCPELKTRRSRTNLTILSMPCVLMIAMAAFSKTAAAFPDTVMNIKKVCLPRISFRSMDSGWIHRSTPISCG